MTRTTGARIQYTSLASDADQENRNATCTHISSAKRYRANYSLEPELDSRAVHRALSITGQVITMNLPNLGGAVIIHILESRERKGVYGAINRPP